MKTLTFIWVKVFRYNKEFADPIISITSDVTTRINNYNDDVAEYRIDLEELNERIENSRRYTKQFSDMNSAVTGFKKTEELLTNFQEAWKASLADSFELFTKNPEDYALACYIS